MSSYIDHREAIAPGNFAPLQIIVTHSWRADLRQRLAWIYGDQAPAREAASAADATVWNRLGQAVAA